jgi:DNA-binding transcriptional ArsR family regulator
MDSTAAKEQLTRLIQRAETAAPSIKHFDADQTYGRVTDEQLDPVGHLQLDILANTILAELAHTRGARYQLLYREYQVEKSASKQWHSKSIWVHKTRQFLQTALAFLQEESANTRDTSRDRALRLLAEVRMQTEATSQPIFVTELGAQTQLSDEQLRAAWRYLKDHGLIKTYRIDYTATVNAQGIDALDHALARSLIHDSTDAPAVAPHSTPYQLPPLPEPLRGVLTELWSGAVKRGRALDAPTFRRDHPELKTILLELERRRCIALEEHTYRLTPLGLYHLDDEPASKVLALAERVRTALAEHFFDEQRRNQPLTLSELAGKLDVSRQELEFALPHLWYALVCWCSKFIPDFAHPQSHLCPRERASELPIEDVAREMARLAQQSRPPAQDTRTHATVIRRCHAIVLVHGIRTQGEWAQGAIQVIESAPQFKVFPFRYEFFDVIRFLVPIDQFRLAAVKRVERLVRDTLSLEDITDVSVICHSFGTWIFSRILMRCTDIRFKRAILCGSVIPDDFEWDRYKAQIGDYPDGHGYIVNDCGIRDIWPVMAKTITWGYGSSGRFGFGHPRVVDRFHDLGHSDFLNRDFIQRYWIPFLQNDQIAPGLSERPTTPWWVSIITMLRLKYLALILLGVTLIAVLVHLGMGWP